MQRRKKTKENEKNAKRKKHRLRYTETCLLKERLLPLNGEGGKIPPQRMDE